MTSEEFMSACFDSGYVSRRDKKHLEKWIENHPKNTYSEDDFIAVYRYFTTPKYGEDVPGGKWHYTWDGHKTTKRYDV